MPVNQLVKRVFGNHNILRRYLQFLKNPDIYLPPFLPVLCRQMACSPNDLEIMLINCKLHHQAKNRSVMNQLIEQYIIYHELQNGE